MHRLLLHWMIFLAVTALTVNDLARLAFPSLQQATVSAWAEEKKQGENPIGTTLLEEEMKHRDLQESCPLPPPPPDTGLDAAARHRITDDEVSHLAFIPIFTPPPDRA